MSNKTEFIHLGDSTYCIKKQKQYLGVGTANYHDNEIEDHPSNLTGETIAYLKAVRDIYKQKLADKKQELKTLEKFHTYLFPAKFTNRADWVAERSEKRLNQIRNEIKELSNTIQEISQEIKKYLNDRADFFSRLKKCQEKESNK